MRRTPSRTVALPIAPALGLALVVALAPARSATAQSVADFVPEVVRDASFPLSIRSIMRGPELVGQAPSGVRWSDDGQSIWFRWVPGGNAWDAAPEPWRVRSDGSGLERV
ncbi:MAG: hypothetical protein RQ751_10445, partial [Longimicrobiales bacterium]|nr:hypothetical protein [Longimicrobiales bacterium]